MDAKKVKVDVIGKKSLFSFSVVSIRFGGIPTKPKDVVKKTLSPWLIPLSINDWIMSCFV